MIKSTSWDIAFEKRSAKSIRIALLECCIPVGYLRWISLAENLSLTFEGIDFKKFVDEKSLTIDRAKLIKTVKDKSQKPALIVSDIQNKIQQIQDEMHDPWHVCCGHDLANVLSIGLSKALGTYNTNEVRQEKIEQSLRLAFEHSYFRKTQLYASIRDWEANNAPYIVLKEDI